MKSRQVQAQPQAAGVLQRAYPGVLGCFLALCLLKFGNPPVMEKWVSPPQDIYEFVIGSPWPIVWGYTLLLFVAALAVPLMRWPANLSRWVVALPIGWLVWQVLASTGSIDPGLSKATLPHLACNVLCFLIGLLALSRARSLVIFWLALLAGFLVVLASGWSQHFGGLEQTRRYFFLYIYPQLKEVPPEYLKKVSSTRIFGTLFYPNALAGVLILLLPALVAAVLSLRGKLTLAARIFVACVVVVASLACLVWSGSKGGWLIMLVVALLAALRLPIPTRAKTAFIVICLAGGLTGFAVRYALFFKRGATSVSARMDYWRAAWVTFREHPLLGTGPGTFGPAYQAVKRPESEPSRLVHNDYLEQASDSGFPGFLAYITFISAALWLSFKRCSGLKHVQLSGLTHNNAPDNWQAYAVWLGLFGWAVQCAVEFGTYIPALSWTAFTLLGWLLAIPIVAAKPVPRVSGCDVKPVSP